MSIPETKRYNQDSSKVQEGGTMSSTNLTRTNHLTTAFTLLRLISLAIVCYGAGFTSMATMGVLALG